MKTSSYHFIKSVLTAIIICSVFAISGCETPQEVEEVKLDPVFYPPLPDKPRLQHLKTFSSSDDIVENVSSAFQDFVLGAPVAKDRIGKPYGVAISDGKIYVCDVGRVRISIIDLEKHTFEPMTRDRRLRSPQNIFIDQGNKYVADPVAGLVFVFDEENELRALLGKESEISPTDVYVWNDRCYVTDRNSNQVVVIDKNTGEEITRIGAQGDKDGQFKFISDMTIDAKGHVFVTDKVMARITEFNSDGIFQRSIGQLGDNINELVRPKGIAIDNDDRIWVVDASTEVCKIYNQQEKLLLFFGGSGNAPGNMYLPAKVIIDYDNVDYFTQYAVEGAKLDFIVIVTNQFGANKVSVYGFGDYPESKLLKTEKESE